MNFWAPLMSFPISGDYHQSLVQPGFRAGKKKGPLWRFSAYFPVFSGRKGPQKNLHQTLVTSDTRVSVVKMLPKILEIAIKSSNLFEGLIFSLACSVHLVRRRFWAFSLQNPREVAQIVRAQNEQSMRVKRSDLQND